MQSSQLVRPRRSPCVGAECQRPWHVPAAVLMMLASVACKQTAPKTEAAQGESAKLELGVAKIADRAPVSSTGTSSAASSGASSGAPSPTGTVRVLSADAAVLQRPTTVAVRGQTLWLSIGQLSALFSDDGKPHLPFGAVSLPLSGGAFGTDVIELPGPDFYPEGITAASDGTIYVGSIMQGVVVKVAPGSTKAVPFVQKGTAHRGVIGITVDAARQLLWFCDSNPKLDDAKKAGELVGVRLSDAREVARHALPRAGEKAPFCNDVIVGPDGTLWLTDSAGGRVLRVLPGAALEAGPAQVWMDGGDVAPPASGGSGANGLEWLDGSLVVANVGRGTLVKLDPKSEDPAKSAQVFALSDAKDKHPVTLCSPDGLERVPGSKNQLVVVENGGCAEKTPRVVEVTLDAG